MDRRLNTQAASDFLGCSRSTLYRYCKRSLIDHINTPYGLFFELEDLKKWLSQHKREAFLANNILKNVLTNSPPIAMDNAGGEEVASKSKARINFGYGAIYQRKYKSGKIRWFLDYYDADHNRVQKVAKNVVTKNEAALALREEVVKIFDKTYNAERKSEKIKFRKFAEIFLKSHSMLKKKAWERSDKVYLHANLVPYFGDYDLTAINTFLVEKFIEKRLKDGVKKSTINRDLACLRKMFNKAIDWDYMIENPILGKIRLFSEEEYKRDRVLTHKEEGRLYQAAASHLRPILTCALMTAMRASEIIRLTWDNCDLEKRQILIKAESSKSGKARIIPINDTLLDELQRLKDVNNGSSDYVFLYEDPKTKKPRPVKSVRKAFVMACRRANIKDLTFHDLRRSASSRLLSKGASIETVRSLLGHHSILTTQRYVHTDSDQKREAVQLLNRKAERRDKREDKLLRRRYVSEQSNLIH